MRAKIIAALAAFALLAACGFKGPLTLPAHENDPPQKAKTTP